MTRNQRLVSCFLFSVPAVAFGGQSPRPLVPAIAIANVTLIDGTGTAAQPHMTVVIVDGRITDIASSATFRPPPGAHIIEGTDQFAIPGLWNMHVHSVNYEQAKKAFPDVLAAGVTGVRDMGSPPDDVLRLRAQTNTGDVLGPHMLVAGPL